ncbi:Rab5/RabF-family small GTPase [Citrus sinensis]|nr:Rab5/RabF-family small GTPase [Citrus sinensis]
MPSRSDLMPLTGVRPPEWHIRGQAEYSCSYSPATWLLQDTPARRTLPPPPAHHVWSPRCTSLKQELLGGLTVEHSSTTADDVLLGDMGTGKTSLALRFIKGQFYDQQEPTIGAAFFTQILSLSEATVKFDIWDTAGQERYHSLAPMYYRGAAAAVVVYDISNMDTFNRANKLVQELQRQGNQIVVMALAANKSDLDSQREVPTEEGEQFSQENGMFYIETSAKTAQNINELFYEIAKRLARVSPPKRSGINLNPETPERKGFCCLG